MRAMVFAAMAASGVPAVAMFGTSRPAPAVAQVEF